MKKSSVRKVSLAAIICCILMFTVCSCCGLLSNAMKNIKGELIGNHFNIEFYDHFGTNTLTIEGEKVGLEANYVTTKSVDSDGTRSTNYEMSSVVTMTVDGHQVPMTGETVIFAEDGLKKLEDFALPGTITTDGGTINIFDRNINKIKNAIGTSKVVSVGSSYCCLWGRASLLGNSERFTQDDQAEH